MAETWQVVRQFGFGHLSGASGIAVTPGCDLVVSDWQSPGQIKFFSRSGEFKYDLDLKQHLTSTETSKPWNAVVSPDENIFITQQLNFVGVFTMNGTCNNKFRAEPPRDITPTDVNESQLWGLAMDNQGCLLVGDFANKYISKHYTDGSHINSFKVSIAPLFIAVTTQDLTVISNGTGGCAQIIDPTGKILHTLQRPPGVSLWWPCSPCCTAQGEIYIANSVLGYSAGVYCYHSESGEFIRCLTRDVEYPTALTLTDYGDMLIVVQSKDIKILVKQ